MINTKIWLDDVRLPPDDTWTWAKTAKEAIRYMELLKQSPAEFTEIAFDHDLGFTKQGVKEETGYTAVLWMAENDVWPTERVSIHSWNTVGAANIAAVVTRYSNHLPEVRRYGT